MSQQNKRSDQGRVVSRVADLLRLARYRWRQKLSPEQVAQATALNPKTVRLMAGEDPEKQPHGYHYRTLERLCWYFGCHSVADLLWWYAPADLSLPPPELVIRDAPPTGREGPHVHIQSRIHIWLEGKPRAQVAKDTGLDFQTISDLMDPSHATAGMGRRTLEALCLYLSLQQGRPITVQELLACEGSAESQAVEDGLTMSPSSGRLRSAVNHCAFTKH